MFSDAGLGPPLLAGRKNDDAHAPSISPVSQHDADLGKASSEQKELVEIDEAKTEEYEPAPREREGKEEIRQPEIWSEADGTDKKPSWASITHCT